MDENYKKIKNYNRRCYGFLNISRLQRLASGTLIFLNILFRGLNRKKKPGKAFSIIGPFINLLTYVKDLSQPSTLQS
jgi:hypothetical protein